MRSKARLDCHLSLTLDLVACHRWAHEERPKVNAVIIRVKELCESQGGHPGLPVPKCPDGLCGHKATLNLNWVVSSEFSAGRKAHRQLIGIAQDDMPGHLNSPQAEKLTGSWLASHKMTCLRCSHKHCNGVQPLDWTMPQSSCCGKVFVNFNSSVVVFLLRLFFLCLIFCSDSMWALHFVVNLFSFFVFFPLSYILHWFYNYTLCIL